MEGVEMTRDKNSGIEPEIPDRGVQLNLPDTADS